MTELLNQIQAPGAKALTHSGKFHADDVFSAALLLYLNPEIEIARANKVPEDFEGLVFDIGRGAYDHHQKDSRIRDNGVPFAAFGLLWEALGEDILGAELAQRFDQDFVQPLDLNDNTGEKNELASLIGDFNPAWDEEGSNDGAFFEAVSLAGTILENKFAKYRGNERADRQVEEFLQGQDGKIFIMPKFVPAQKKLADTDVEFIVFPSNRGGYCIQPLKKQGSMNYKCSFPAEWLGLEGEALQQASGLASANFCHKGGFIMTVGELEDAVKACKISQKIFVEEPVIVYYRDDVPDGTEADYAVEQLEVQLKRIPGMERGEIKVFPTPELPELTEDEYYLHVDVEKEDWKQMQKAVLKEILKVKPEAVIVDAAEVFAYPMIHLLRKKHVPVLTVIKVHGEMRLVRIPSGS